MTATTLGHVADTSGGLIQTGPFGSQLHAADYSPKGVAVVMPQDIVDGRISRSNVARIPSVIAQSLKRHGLSVGDIVYSRRGDVERSALISEDDLPAICGTGCLLVRTQDRGYVDPAFLHAQLQLPQTRAWVRRHAVGATMLNLNTKILQGVPVWLPAIHTQRAITEVLGALDDKIASNQRFVMTSDALIRARFESLRKTSGRVRSLSDVTDVVRSTSQPGGDGIYLGLEHLPRRLMFAGGCGVASDVSSAKSSFSPGDVLFGKLRPYFHKVVAAPGEGVCSTDILVLRAKQHELCGLVLAAVASDEFVALASSVGSGTKMPRARWSDLSEFKVPWPGQAAVMAFSAQVAALRDAALARLEESRTLASLRDALLPGLMDGSIRVKDAAARVADQL